MDHGEGIKTRRYKSVDAQQTSSREDGYEATTVIVCDLGWISVEVAGVDVGETRVGGCQVQDHRRDNEFQGSNEMTGGEEGGMSRGLGRGGTRGERVDGRKGRERSKRIEREEKEEEEKQMSEKEPLEVVVVVGGGCVEVEGCWAVMLMPTHSPALTATVHMGDPHPHLPHHLASTNIHIRSLARHRTGRNTPLWRGTNAIYQTSERHTSHCQ
ncbi:hypothetical protein An09g04040 [Aspergillus niger]|uniref:Uncharacterized protein n=2 Tax=Aspergillus niger TaxID=5061 RepID=A2QU18_ASPNC|nr:hypothetical protein An09g04040 [Aspergillus niger]CAK96846.1 hypothetical protein An09g04040 [Aspergillus niger]